MTNKNEKTNQNQRKIDLRKLKYFVDIDAFDLGDGDSYIYPDDELWVEITKRLFKQADRIFKSEELNK